MGKPLCEVLSKNYNVIAIGSSDVNVVDFKQVKDFFDQHQIDIVLNLSGRNYDSFVHKYNEENQHFIDELIAINIKGSINIVRACLPNMRARNYGRIVLISSILADSPVISTGIYAGTKGFLDSFAKTVALENASKNITCNTLQLGYFDGGLTYKIPENFRKEILASIPMKRFGNITELADIIEMLIRVPYITGTNLKANGGQDF